MRTLTRKPDGTFTRPTLANTFGLGNRICTCGGMNPWKVGIEQEPTICGHCNRPLSPAPERSGGTTHAESRTSLEVTSASDGTSEPEWGAGESGRLKIHGEIWGVGRKGAGE